MLSIHATPRMGMGRKRGWGGKEENERDQRDRRKEKECVYLKITYKVRNSIPGSNCGSLVPTFHSSVDPCWTPGQFKYIPTNEPEKQQTRIFNFITLNRTFMFSEDYIFNISHRCSKKI